MGSLLGMARSNTVVPTFVLKQMPVPPQTLAEPGRVQQAVKPAPLAAAMPVSNGLSESMARSWAVTGEVFSFTSGMEGIVRGSFIVEMCECASIKPGVTHLPLRSSTFAPLGTRGFAPTDLIRPFSMTTTPFSYVLPVTVTTFAFFRTRMDMFFLLPLFYFLRTARSSARTTSSAASPRVS